MSVPVSMPEERTLRDFLLGNLAPRLSERGRRLAVERPVGRRHLGPARGRRLADPGARRRLGRRGGPGFDGRLGRPLRASRTGEREPHLLTPSPRGRGTMRGRGQRFRYPRNWEVTGSSRDRPRRDGRRVRGGGRGTPAGGWRSRCWPRNWPRRPGREGPVPPGGPGRGRDRARERGPHPSTSARTAACRSSSCRCCRASRWTTG